MNYRISNKIHTSNEHTKLTAFRSSLMEASKMGIPLEDKQVLQCGVGFSLTIKAAITLTL